MAISNLAQFGLLLWKNWLLQKRRIVVTIFQIIIPVLFAVILLGIRALVESEFEKYPTTWDSFEASTLPPIFVSKPTTGSTFPPNLTLPLSPRNETSTTSLGDQTSLLNMALPPDTTFSPNLTATQNTTSPDDSMTSLLNVTLAPDAAFPSTLTATQNTMSPGDSTSLLSVTLASDATFSPSLTGMQNATSPDNQTSLLNVTLPPDTTFPPTQSNKWRLVFSPSASKTAERIANKTAQALDMMPPVGKSMMFLDHLLFHCI